MIEKVVRWCLVRIVAFGLRRGITPGVMLGKLAETHPHRDRDWRLDLVSEAKARAERRRVRVG